MTFPPVIMLHYHTMHLRTVIQIHKLTPEYHLTREAKRWLSHPIVWNVGKGNESRINHIFLPYIYPHFALSRNNNELTPLKDYNYLSSSSPCDEEATAHCKRCFWKQKMLFSENFCLFFCFIGSFRQNGADKKRDGNSVRKTINQHSFTAQ